MELDPLRLTELDQQDELYNCTWHLVLAAQALTDAVEAVNQSRHYSPELRLVALALALALAFRDDVIRALNPFEKP